MKNNSVKTFIKKTLNLPHTPFSMKGNLPEKEPYILRAWKKEHISDVVSTQQTIKKDEDIFVLHDGPPYANGHLHMGHALNKILKDIILRSRMSIFDQKVHYRPGWDCHGLPIEWKVREAQKANEMLEPRIFRKKCRHFAEKWMSIQKKEFERFGLIGGFNNFYNTMDFSAESSIIKTFFDFVKSGNVYRGSKPVMWSVIEQSAFAEAEVEHKEHLSDTIFVLFPVKETQWNNVEERKNGLFIVIWTTTPWTIPANRALAYSEDIHYGVYEITNCLYDDKHIGKMIVVSDKLKNNIEKEASITLSRRRDFFFEKTSYHHPLHEMGYTHAATCHDADFVTDEAGTGVVHIAPEFGPEDHALALKNAIEITDTIDKEGVYRKNVPIFSGIKILDDLFSFKKANMHVCKKLHEAHNLLSRSTVRHMYPHSWRSKAPLIYKNTSQWFISMSAHDLRERALQCLPSISFIPPSGQKRLHDMITKRPDWVISRQRLWGVPIALFVHKETGEILKDDNVYKKIEKEFLHHGSDIWYEKDSVYFLNEDHTSSLYEKVTDILDVWFDSGCTHTFVIPQEKQADMYLEGSDQFRGWFQSSVITSTQTKKTSPTKSIVTHGFVLDEDGKKMSKSLGNIIAPDTIIQKYGADVLRIWVSSVDYTNDVCIGEDTINNCIENYKKIRNTLRYMLSAIDVPTSKLSGKFFSLESLNNTIDMHILPPLEKFILFKLTELISRIENYYQNSSIKRVLQDIMTFITNELSSFYFDVRKDCLYCDSQSCKKRQACQYVLQLTFQALVRMLSPIIPFTTEEAWQHSCANKQDDVYEAFKENNLLYPSIHTQKLSDIKQYLNKHKFNISENIWNTIKDIRRVVLVCLEIQRKNGIIGSGLEASPEIFIKNKKITNEINQYNIHDMCIVSSYELNTYSHSMDGWFSMETVDGIYVRFRKAKGEKCERCWKVLKEVVECSQGARLCKRCLKVVQEVMQEDKDKNENMLH